jgi:phosphomevalonate decarboxylase
MKVTARAYPLQGLIAHNLLDDLQLPFLDSVSVCTAPFSAVTTFEFQEMKEVIINGSIPDSYTVSRINSVVSEVKKLSGIDEEYKIVSQNNIPRGLEPFSSVFASVAVAASKAAGLDLSHKELSWIARKGIASASRSVTGWFSRWRANLQDKFCYSFVIEDDLPMGMVAALVEPFTFMNVKEVLASPFLESWLKSMHTHLYEMEKAIKDHDIPRIGELAEKESVYVHALAPAEKSNSWSSDALRVMAEVKTLREEGIHAYFSIDAEAVVYINSYPEEVPVIAERIRKLGIQFVELSVGGEAHVIQEHLF